LPQEILGGLFFLSVLLLPVFKSLGLANIFHLSILFRFSQLEDGTSIGLFFLFFFKNSTDFSFQEKKKSLNVYLTVLFHLFFLSLVTSA